MANKSKATVKAKVQLRLCGGYGFGFGVGGGEIAQVGYGCRNQREGLIYFFLGGELREGEADAGSGAGGREAHGGEDVGGLGGSGLAGAASADGEAFEVEGDDEGFGFDVIEVDVGGVGDAWCASAVDACFVDLS